MKQMTRQEVITNIALSAKETLGNSYRVYINYPIIYQYRDIPLNDCISELSPVFYENDPLNQLGIVYNNNNSLDSYTSHLRNKLGSNQYGLNNEWVPSQDTLNSYRIKYEAVADIAIAHDDSIIEYMFIQFTDTILLDQYEIDTLADGRYNYIKISTPPVDIYYKYYNKTINNNNSTRSIYSRMTDYYRPRRPYQLY